MGVKFYSEFEERLNIASHKLGIWAGVVALVLFVIKSFETESWVKIACYIIFSLSLILLYSASTLYHSATSLPKRKKLKIFDHAAIYVLIAGSYTPLTLITLKDANGSFYFFTAWIMAISGVILKLFYTGRFKIISTLLYVLMGWMIMFAINPLTENLSPDGLFWLLLGGISYTVGAVFYVIPFIKYNHAIFHVFVLLGSLAHIVCVYFYVN